MKEININIHVDEEDAVAFIRCVRHLLRHTFLLKDKDEKLFRYAVRPASAEKLSDYFSGAGYDYMTDEQSGVCWIMPDSECLDTQGLRRKGYVSFSKDRYFIFLVLWEILEEKTMTGTVAYATLGEVVDRLHSYHYETDRRSLKSALTEFMQYDLIDFEEPYNENTIIRLYPSIKCINFEKEFAKTAQNAFSKTEEDDEEEEDTE